jgi:Uma2 family endonuclease
MSVSASAGPAAGRRYTYADLEAIPEDNVRREIIDGELIVHASPVPRHQEAAGNLFLRLREYASQAGGKAYFAPLDVYFAEDNVVEPDLMFVRADHLERIGDKNMQGPPDLVVEISLPSTRRLDLVRKLDLYQRFGVPEFWLVDLEAERVEVHVLAGDTYPAPAILYPGQSLQSAGLPGLSVPVDEALAEE